MKSELLPAILALGCLSFVEGDGGVGTLGGARIINGVNADPEEFPYMVHLLRGRTEMCGGAVISSYYIVTAAQCVYEDNCSRTRIFPLSSTSTSRNIVEIYISACIPHPSYEPSDFVWDIGLVRTTQNLVLELELGVLGLTMPNTVFPAGTRGFIVGWGKTEDSTYPGRLRRGAVTVESQEVCNTVFQNANECIGGGKCPVSEITDKSMCTTGTGARPVSACDGDFGGPLIINGYLAGIISGAVTHNGQCRGEYSTLHSAVAPFYWWIAYHVFEGGENQ